MPEIGVAIPVYNAAATVERVVAQVHGALDGAGLTHRIALVDDGSTDGSWEVLRTLAQRDGRLRCVRLARNCGQQGALLCALGELRGCAYVATMDDDLGHSASMLPSMHRKLREGYELVYALPEGQARSPVRRAGSRLRDGFFSLLFPASRGVRVGSYRMMTAELAGEIRKEQAAYVYLSASAFRYRPRAANLRYKGGAGGDSRYTLWALVKLYGKLMVYYTPLGRPLRKKGEPFEAAEFLEGREGETWAAC